LSQDSSVTIVTGYRLGDCGWISGRGREFSLCRYAPIPGGGGPGAYPVFGSVVIGSYSSGWIWWLTCITFRG